MGFAETTLVLALLTGTLQHMLFGMSNVRIFLEGFKLLSEFDMIHVAEIAR
jgi:hypothetical protein